MNSYLQSLIRSSNNAISKIAVSAVESFDSKLNVTFSILSSYERHKKMTMKLYSLHVLLHAFILCFGPNQLITYELVALTNYQVNYR